MFVTADQILCHLIGDYLLQSHWMAQEKQQRNLAAWAHGMLYGLPFLFLKPHWHTFAIIVISHWLIDHFKLARFVVYAKNFLSPRWTLEISEVSTSGLPLNGSRTEKEYNKRWWWRPWHECNSTGYPNDVPAFLAVWLYIIADNTLHIICNGLAFYVQAHFPF